MSASLTDIERKILDYMVQYLRSNTYQPSIREIGERFGIKSTKTVSEHLQALADKGFLERDPSRSRGVRILDVDLSADVVPVPFYRDMPKERIARDGAETYLSLDRRLGGGRGSFFVRAKGDELELRALFTDVTQGLVPRVVPFYCPVPTNFDPGLAPPGKQLLTVCALAPTSDVFDATQGRGDPHAAWEEAMLATLRRVVPGLDDHVEFMDRFSVKFIEHWIGKEHGPAISTGRSVVGPQPSAPA